MKKAQLSGSLRANVGKKDATALRNAGRVPCVLYGQGEQTHFSVKSIDMEKLIFSPDVYQVELDLEGKKVSAVIKDLQMHPVKDKPRHVDFYQLDEKKPIRISLPLRTTGAAVGVISGGKFRQAYRMLKVEGLPSDLPEAIVVDITKMRIGHMVRVSDLKVPKVTLLDPQNAVLISIKTARGAVAEIAADDEEAEETAPEVEVTEAAAE